MRRARFVFNLCCQGGSQGVKSSASLAQIMHNQHNHAQLHNHYSNFENILMKLHNHTQSYTIKQNYFLKDFFKF